jgi:hypothetical protein
MYDALAGFSVDAVNPFDDTSFPADQVFVDEVSCAGCGPVCCTVSSRHHNITGSAHSCSELDKQRL